MIKSKYYSHYLVVANDRNWLCHLFHMQVSRYGNVQILLSVLCYCEVPELVLPSVYHAGVQACSIPNVIIIIGWLHLIGIGLATCLLCRFPGMVKSNCSYHYLVVADDWNCPCHLFTMQVCKHEQIQQLLVSYVGCKVSELLLPSAYPAGVQA
jgi:hypothetical protein